MHATYFILAYFYLPVLYADNNSKSTGRSHSNLTHSLERAQKRVIAIHHSITQLERNEFKRSGSSGSIKNVSCELKLIRSLTFAFNVKWRPSTVVCIHCYLTFNGDHLHFHLYYLLFHSFILLR